MFSINKINYFLFCDFDNIVWFSSIFRSIYNLSFNMQTKVKSKFNDKMQGYKVNMQADKLKILENRVIFRQ